MSSSTASALTQLLGTKFGTAQVYAFFLVLARITPLFVIAPLFSSTMLIPRVRSVLAIGLAFVLTPIAEHGAMVPTTTLGLVGQLMTNLLVGFVIAFAVAAVFAAVQAAGTLADSFSGFSFGQMVDPVNGNPGGVLTNFYTIVGLALFLAIGGDAWMLRGLAATFHVMPLGTSPLVRPLTGSADTAFAGVLLGGVEIAAPLILAMVIADVAFGMVSRVVPQLNVFAVGFPVKISVGLIVAGASLPFLAGWLSNEVGGALSSALASL